MGRHGASRASHGFPEVFWLFQGHCGWHPVRRRLLAAIAVAFEEGPTRRGPQDNQTQRPRDASRQRGPPTPGRRTHDRGLPRRGYCYVSPGKMCLPSLARTCCPPLSTRRSVLSQGLSGREEPAVLDASTSEVAAFFPLPPADCNAALGEDRPLVSCATGGNYGASSTPAPAQIADK